jgi:hypothetical protein
MRWTMTLAVSSRATARTASVMTRPMARSSSSFDAFSAASAAAFSAAAFSAAATLASTAASSAVHVGLGLRKSATRGETMPVAKSLNAASSPVVPSEL